MPNLQFNEKLELQQTKKKHTHTHTHWAIECLDCIMGRMCIVYSGACLGAKVWIKSISSGAQYVTTSSKAPGPIIMISRPIRNTEQNQLDPIYYTLFCRCTALLLLLPLFTSHGLGCSNPWKIYLLSQNPFSWVEPTFCWISFIIQF
jgi:hypothetical protein